MILREVGRYFEEGLNKVQLDEAGKHRQTRQASACAREDVDEEEKEISIINMEVNVILESISYTACGVNYLFS